MLRLSRIGPLTQAFEGGSDPRFACEVESWKKSSPQNLRALVKLSEPRIHISLLATPVFNTCFNKHV